jgi:hypothetical protein
VLRREARGEFSQRLRVVFHMLTYYTLRLLEATEYPRSGILKPSLIKSWWLLRF